MGFITLTQFSHEAENAHFEAAFISATLK